jgi:penicillin V acylase-like amidase (Ntn superfamily)
MKRDGLAGLTWTSKYGSVITSAYEIASRDGMNERSLASHMLWLAESDYGMSLCGHCLLVSGALRPYINSDKG